MKKIVLITVLSIAMTTLFAQKEQQSNERTMSTILEKGTQAQKDSVIQVILVDAKLTKNENDLRRYTNILRYMKLTKEAEVVESRAIKLYPNGRVARDRDIAKFGKFENVQDKEKLYNAILKKYPIKNFPGDEIAYDYITSALAVKLAEERQKGKALNYLGNMQERFWRAQGYIPVARILLDQGDTLSAMPLIKTSIDDALAAIRSSEPDLDNKNKFAAVGYPGYVQLYSIVLLAQGKYIDAINYIEDAVKIVPEREKEFRPAYAKALEMAGRELEAYNLYASLYADGQFSFREPLEKLYVKLNKGQRTGFEDLLMVKQAELKQNIKYHLSQIVTDKETPIFKLRNIKGEMVDSKSLLGKVVVLDFWATWCKPCINSFPGMQKAVTKYQNDPEVLFLFIDTWERDDKYEQKVKDFISENNYTFNVLFDDKTTDVEIAPKFGIQGIPAKFVIDKKGKTRFSLTGSSPYPDYILMEVSEMIEWAKRG